MWLNFCTCLLTTILFYRHHKNRKLSLWYKKNSGNDSTNFCVRMFKITLSSTTKSRVGCDVKYKTRNADLCTCCAVVMETSESSCRSRPWQSRERVCCWWACPTHPCGCDVIPLLSPERARAGTDRPDYVIKSRDIADGPPSCHRRNSDLPRVFHPAPPARIRRWVDARQEALSTLSK